MLFFKFILYVTGLFNPTTTHRPSTGKINLWEITY